MRIKNLLDRFAFPVYLAPMEGVTDHSFRMVCKEKGADILISEFISSDALSREVDKSIRKMGFEERERPFGIQIFGHNEASLIAAAQMAEEAGPDFIDINWGCPVRKVVTKGAGAGILQDIPKMVALTSAVVQAVKLPVTVKTRLGWEQSNKPIVEVAERLQDVGIEGITIHGRTRAQMYGGEADWTLIGQVKENPRMNIPVIGNGDIDSADKAIAYQKRYGVDGIMIGRAAIGNPWIFQDIKDRLSGLPIKAPTYEERVRTALGHLQVAIEEKGERRAVLEMRAMYAGYFKGLYNFKSIRMQLMKADTMEECQRIMALYSPDKPSDFNA
ncbi:MAG: tRNA dihydrouridine synthase DusB [Bacteroidales bacterium]|nr:tRNA dihydrouridine synthase DusB [Bacteroidales bacterium]